MWVGLWDNQLSSWKMKVQWYQGKIRSWPINEVRVSDRWQSMGHESQDKVRWRCLGDGVRLKVEDCDRLRGWEYMEEKDDVKRQRQDIFEGGRFISWLGWSWG